ncbi:MAG: recombinase family protein [Micromonosporaceae bacterium]|nr:recombinase family protein [Micromonosporaceae bacterium]
MARRLRWHVAEVVTENDVDPATGKPKPASAFKRRKVRLPNGRYELRVIRPGFRRVLDQLAGGRADALLAEDLDRTMRDPRDAEDLIDAIRATGGYADSLSGSLKFTAGGTDAEVMQARILVAVGNKSSADTARRVAAARERQATSGQYGGGRRPYGFEPDGITRREPECKVIADAAYAIARGATLRGLARDLRDRQVPTVTGRAAWSAQTLRDILVRPRNAGRLIYRGEVVGTAGWEPIVPGDVHDRVVALLGDEKRDTRAGTAARWLLSGLAVCGLCGSPVEITIGGRAPRYRCKATPHLTRAQAHVDKFVVGVVLGWVRRDFPEVFVPARPEIDAAALRAEQQAIEDNLTAMAADAAVDVTGRLRRQLRAANKRAEVRLAEIDQELSAADGPDPDLVELATAADPMAVWDSLTLERQRMVVQATVVVTIEPVGRRGRGFDPGSVRIEPAAQ